MINLVRRGEGVWSGVRPVFIPNFAFNFSAAGERVEGEKGVRRPVELKDILYIHSTL